MFASWLRGGQLVVQQLIDGGPAPVPEVARHVSEERLQQLVGQPVGQCPGAEDGRVTHSRSPEVAAEALLQSPHTGGWDGRNVEGWQRR